MQQATVRLQGKVAIVTGAGSVGPGWGNGRAIAVRFAQEGARVFAIDKDLSAMDETLALVREFGALYAAVRKWVEKYNEQVATSLGVLGAEIKPLAPDEYAAYLRNQNQLFSAGIKTLGN